MNSLCDSHFNEYAHFTLPEFFKTKQHLKRQAVAVRQLLVLYFSLYIAEDTGLITVGLSLKITSNKLSANSSCISFIG